MAIEFRVPDLGENIDSADVGQILVKEGETISAGKNVLELETEKAVFEVECPHAGTITKIHVKPGDTVTVGTLILSIEQVGSVAASSPAPPPPAKSAAAPSSTTTPTKPSTVSAMPSAATRPAPATSNGDRPSPAMPAPARPTSAAPAAAALAPPADYRNDEKLPPPAAPATRRLARELGVDLYDVAGSGPGGRITQEDVRLFVKSRMSGGVVAGSAGVSLASPGLPDFTEFGPVERIRMSKLNVTAAGNLSLAWQTIPHVTQHDLADITEVESARRKMVGDPKYKGPKITMTVVAVKACVAAIKAMPNFNASIDTRSNEIIQKHFYNIGIAVDTENGLLVPVIKNADTKSIRQIADEILDLSEKARARKLDIGSMKGGTFTITNLGGIGGTGFTPIVNWPEVAILGMSRSFEQPRLVEGRLENRLMLPLSLSYDHRVINGADAARFVRRLCELLSDPFALLSEI
jgi:pyruvate dehydrogenase E2 component (dihydrolipoamide acetyltransferase)